MSRFLGFAFLVFGLSALPASACGTSATCADVQASIYGSIGMEGLTIEWSSSNDTCGVHHYSVSRISGANSYQVGTLSVNYLTDPPTSYGMQDRSGAPYDAYSVSVYSGPTTIACTYSVAPQ